MVNPVAAVTDDPRLVLLLEVLAEGTEELLLLRLVAEPSALTQAVVLSVAVLS